MKKSYHLCYDKEGLVRTVLRESKRGRPPSWVTDGDGKPFATVAAAVLAIGSVPTAYVPIACPTPNEEGRCPGHEQPEGDA